MFTAKSMWRTQMAEKIISEAPHEGWDAKTRIVHCLYLSSASGTPATRSPAMLTSLIYKTESEHTIQMVQNACIELANQGILSTHTEIPLVMYRLHSDMLIVLESVTSHASKAIRH
uniref:Uncharacterized protein n=1 Tax=Burkholderia phage vB_BgluM-SURPRISE13 TaxID=3159457 RepID=A0AAU7PGX4_9VIRU